MKVTLTDLDVPNPDGGIVLETLPVILGRDPECGVRIADRWVSRRHCTIDRLDDTLVVRDLGSKHGTYVNGGSVIETLLLPGDKLRVGMTRFAVSYRRIVAGCSGAPGNGAPACSSSARRPTRANSRCKSNNRKGAIQPCE